jgi:hypothetical protein
LAGALELVREWSPAARAVILSGSHAAGEAVWAEHQGRVISLSDVDLYVLLDDESACRAARALRGAALGDVARRTLGFGLAAPFEAGFHTSAGLSRLPARPGTIELGRHGRVILGEARALKLVPRHRPGDVTAEEIVLLLENRACELLWCRPRLASPDPLARLQGRHAVLKSALDLTGALALLGGAYPDGARARVTWAREHRGRLRAAGEEAAAREEDGLWDAALAWRAGNVAVLAPAEAEEEWGAVVRGWIRAWTLAGARVVRDAPGEPVARAVALARRARLRRRLRDAITARAPRLAHALRGTLAHRVYASAALLLLAGARDGPLPPRTAAALASLGVGPRAASAGWEDARRAVVLAWDRKLLDGQRTAELP